MNPLRLPCNQVALPYLCAKLEALHRRASAAEGSRVSGLQVLDFAREPGSRTQQVPKLASSSLKIAFFFLLISSIFCSFSS
jgi:hypothetical protein